MVALPGQEQPCGVATAGHAQASTRLVEVAVDGVLRDAQPAGDFLRMKMVSDQPEAFPLARGQPIYRRRVVSLPHNR